MVVIENDGDTSKTYYFAGSKTWKALLDEVSPFPPSSLSLLRSSFFVLLSSLLFSSLLFSSLLFSSLLLASNTNAATKTVTPQGKIEKKEDQDAPQLSAWNTWLKNLFLLFQHSKSLDNDRRSQARKVDYL